MKAAPPAGDSGAGEADRQRTGDTLTPDTSEEKFESFERVNSIREKNGNFD